MYKIYTIIKIIFVFIFDIDFQKMNRFLELKFNGYISAKMFDIDVIKLPWNFKLLKRLS